MLQQNAPLNAAQDKALAALLAGMTQSEAAKEAGVDRTTIYRWLQSDFAFQARLNAGRRERWDADQVRLAALTSKALATVEKAVEDGDVKASLAVLRGGGLLPGRPPSIGSDDPVDLQTNHAHGEKIRALQKSLLSA